MLIDVRTPEEYADGHIEGAINVELSPDMVQELPPAARQEVVELYCRSGGRAGAAAQLLQAAGYRAKNIGGIDELMAQGYSKAR